MTLWKKKLTDSSVICLIAAVLMIVAIFLPYAVARGEFANVLAQIPESECIEGTNITLRSMNKVSMVEFLKIYAASPAGAGAAKFCGWLVGIMGAAALLSGVFALLKKPAALLFCNVAVFAAFYLHNGNYSSRQVVPSWEYRYGIGYYLLFVAAIVSVAGAVWMLRERKKGEEPQEKQD